MHSERARQWVHIGSGSFALLLRVLTWWQAAALAFTIAAPIAAAIAAAFVETIPVRLDDNVSVPAAAAVVLWLASEMDSASWQAACGAVVAALPWAIALNALTAWGGHRARTVSASGAIAGAIVGMLIYAGSGPGGW